MPLYQIIKEFWTDEDGATAMEYGLLAALIAATVVGSQQALGGAVDAMYTTAMGLIVSAMNGSAS